VLSRVTRFSSAGQGERKILAPGSMIPYYGRSLGNVSFLCSRDYLQITNEKNWFFGKYCGHMTGKTVLVSGKYMLIKFHSDSNIQDRGFLMEFSAAVPTCKK